MFSRFGAFGRRANEGKRLTIWAGCKQSTSAHVVFVARALAVAYVLGMSNTNNKRIEIGFNNNGETFWDAVSCMEIINTPAAISRLGFTGRSVTVTAKEADALRDWCATVPGWDENPLVFIEV